MATARGVVISHDSNLLAENGGYIDITKDWAKRLLQRMNMVKRQGHHQFESKSDAFRF